MLRTVPRDIMTTQRASTATTEPITSRPPEDSTVTRICFVCLGNICRSPTAEGIFFDLVKRHELERHFEIDSAGTGGWHVGADPDPRSIEEAARHGVALPSKARQFQAEDFRSFDHLIAMDQSNLKDMLSLCPDPSLSGKAKLLRDFDPQNTQHQALDVPDPYYGKDDGFARVYDICERSCAALLSTLKTAP